MPDTDPGRGGFEFIGPWGVSVAPNITSGHDGIGNYTDAGLAAIILYLRSLPALDAKG